MVCPWRPIRRPRSPPDTVPVTHEYLSQMLGVRRSGVTVAVGELEQAGLVSRGRGFVRVADAPALAAVACGCYGLLSEEYGGFINNLLTPQGFPTYSPDGSQRL